MKKKITRLSLDELRAIMPVLKETEQRYFIGGGSGNVGRVYTQQEYDAISSSGTWMGGYVEGLGYVGPEVTISGNGSDSQDKDGADKDTDNTEAGNSGFFISMWNSHFPPLPEHPSGFIPDDNRNISGGVYGDDNFVSNNTIGGGGGSIDRATALTDGININDTKNFTFEMKEDSPFTRQLQEILKSNSVAKVLSSFFEKGIVHLTFGVSELASSPNSITIAETSFISEKLYRIDFNSSLINANGWNNESTGKDNIGYDFSKAQSMEEKLIITVIHELMHANHVARYQAAMRENKRNYEKAAEWLKKAGYSQEFVDIFIKEENGIWTRTSNEHRIQGLHEYIQKYNHGIIDQALEEYRKEHKNSIV